VSSACTPSGLAPVLKALGLSGILDTLDARLAEARAGTLGHAELLQVLCEDELARREAGKSTRRIKAARFPEQATLESFDFTASPRLPAAQIRDLARAGLHRRRRGYHRLWPGRRRQKPAPCQNSHVGSELVFL
jgi:IstB-like ATP binding protein